MNTEGKNRKERVLVNTKIKKSDLTLPKEIGETLKGLSLTERKAYTQVLRNAGWTLQSIATPLGVTREAIRLYTTATLTPEAIEAINNLPIPEVPTIEIYKDRLVKVLPKPEVLARLKELQAKATLVRGKGKAHREEAEQYTKLLYETLESGVSGYRLAKELGVTHSAILFRLVRYGYTTSTGKSRTYRQLTHRKESNNA
jgi:predicted transcriptional regulator